MTILNASDNSGMPEPTVASSLINAENVFILSFFLGAVDVTLQKLITYVLR